MKVNIITQPLFENYGGILQNFALQEVLRRLGHEPLTLNVPPRRPQSSLVDSAKRVVKMMLGQKGLKLTAGSQFDDLCRKATLLQDFRRRHIASVDLPAPFGKDVAEKYKADAYIVGSDQIWRPWCSFYMHNNFFDFVEDPDTIRISYAASLGTDQWEIDPQTTADIRPLAKRFQAISVREQSGIQLVKDNLGCDAVQVLDPTLLLSTEDYRQVAEREWTAAASSEPYIGVYVLDQSPAIKEFINNLSQELGLPVRYTGLTRRASAAECENLKVKSENLDQSENLKVKSENLDQSENLKVKSENLDQSENLKVKSENLDQSENLKVKSENFLTFNSSLLTFKVKDSIEHWLATLGNAAFVVTDSFHGTAFSINFGRQFVTLGNPLRGTARFSSILSKFGLNDHLAAPSPALIRQISSGALSIDYSRLAPILTAERARSLSFLTENLRVSGSLCLNILCLDHLCLDQEGQDF